MKPDHARQEPKTTSAAALALRNRGVSGLFFSAAFSESHDPFPGSAPRTTPDPHAACVIVGLVRLPTPCSDPILAI